MNDKIKIITDSGEQVEAQAPIIISASRSTDIPAFYAKWFVNRLKAGYCIWKIYSKCHGRQKNNL